MAKKATITDVSTGYQSNTTMNDNFEALNDAFDNTLSLDGSTPNEMGADLDMDSNDILNAKDVKGQNLYLNGIKINPTSLVSASELQASYETTAEMVAATDLVAGSYVLVTKGYNSEEEFFKIEPAATYTANAQEVINLTGSTLQAVTKRVWSKTLAELFADTRGVAHLPDGAALEAEGFQFEADSTAPTGHPTNAGLVQLRVLPNADGGVNFAAFNPAADGSSGTPTDDYPKFAAAEAMGVPVLVPEGDYYCGTRLVIEKSSFSGVNANRAKIYSGTALGEFVVETKTSERGGSIDNVSLEATADGQSGLLKSGTVSSEANQIFVNNFTDTSVQLGDAASGKGIYWSKLGRIRIRLDTDKNGTTGLLIDGQTLPGSNDNSLEDVVIGGNFVNSLHLKGNGNTIKNGTIELTRGDENVSSLIKIEGGGNRVIDMYVEPVGTPPNTIVECTSTSSGNDVELWPQFVPNHNVDASISDSGTHNKVKLKRVGDNFRIGPEAEPTANLILNSAYDVWRDANNPAGWLFGSARVGRVAPAATGEPSVLRMTEVASSSSIQHYLSDYFTSTSKAVPYDLAYFAGKPVTCGVWCRTTVEGAGGVRLNSTPGGGLGVDNHSGSGNWELLIAHGNMPSNVSRLWMELRSHRNNSAITGTVDFRDPFFVVGSDIPFFRPKPLHDGGSKMFGDLDLPLDYSDKALGGVIVLHGHYLWVSTTGVLRIHSSRPTDGNWDTAGTVVGAQT